MKKFIALLILACLIVIVGCSSDSKHAIEWTAEKNYKVAVGDIKYDGDHILPGRYRFYPSNVENRKGIPVVWDIFLSKNDYRNMNELKKEELLGSVGGVEKEEFTKEIPAGTFLYVKYNKVLKDPYGILIADLQK